MNPLTLNKTATTKFILPMLFKDVKFNKVLIEGFRNAYVADFDKPEFDDHILIVFKDELCEFDTIFAEFQKDLVDTYMSNKDFIHVFKIPEGMESDYYEVIAGNYSAISDTYKKQLLNFWDKDDNSDLYKVLYKRIEDVKNKLYELEHDVDYDRLTELYPTPKLAHEIYNMGGVAI